MLPTIEDECREFLALSGDLPILKNLPVHSDGFRKVKVRRKKLSDPFVKTFNSAFFHEHEDLILRAVFANGTESFVPSTSPDLEPFYIFPIDGFRFMYSPHVKCSSIQYKETFDKLTSALGSELSMEMLADVLKYDYVFDDLAHGISSGAEVIFYDIPYYYAVRQSLIADYLHFIYN